MCRRQVAGAAWYAANRTAILARQAAHDAANKETKSIYDAAYYESNREAIRSRKVAYHIANREAILSQKSVYGAANRERAAASKAARRARKRAVGGDLTVAMETELRQSATHCAMCSEELVRTEGHHHPRYPNLDHIIPQGVGGPHSLANVRMVCRDCNLRRPKDGSDVMEGMVHE